MNDRWAAIHGYEGLYEVSDKGAVRALERRGLYPGRWGLANVVFPARDMRISTQNSGYRYVSLKLVNGKSTKHLIHRVVMRAFVGEPSQERYQVNHIDGDKSNNRLENLEYCSASENLLHLTRVLKRKIGGAGGYSKLTQEQAQSILSDGRTLKEIGDEYGVSLQAVWMVKSGKSWAHLQSPMPPRRAN